MDLDFLYRDSEALGRRLQSAFPTYNSQSKIVEGTFSFDNCIDYVYDPGWGPLPDFDSETEVAIDDNWYARHC